MIKFTNFSWQWTSFSSFTHVGAHPCPKASLFVFVFINTDTCLARLIFTAANEANAPLFWWPSRSGRIWQPRVTNMEFSQARCCPHSFCDGKEKKGIFGTKPSWLPKEYMSFWWLHFVAIPSCVWKSNAKTYLFDQKLLLDLKLSDINYGSRWWLYPVFRHEKTKEMRAAATTCIQYFGQQLKS